MGEFETLLYKEEDGVAWVTLNRPEVHNAFNSTMRRELSGLWTDLRDRDGVRCVVLTASGDQAFCTGIDRADIAPGIAEGRDFDPLAYEDPSKELGPKSRGLWKPVVAAVNGPAVGIGASLAFACDLILAAESAFFGLAFVNIGLMPDGGSTLFVPAAAGKARALQMALLGEPVPAETALGWGLVNAVHPDDRLMEEANTLVARLAAGPTRSYAASKRALNRMLYPDLEGQLALEAEIQHELGRTDDFLEGVGAFVERRSATFKGR